ncbi:Prolyl 3-hydroxylase 2 [Bagarius yarrelli]|uniref:procollagen-proline 3-dioxygenase n=1 Tax=Bagarius yarrelli TaxID=175774 RepID=A0A556VCB6_BAGYA|nr:Prolyl 3-hydroxylase 2 [Bagarius yarrelli]
MEAHFLQTCGALTLILITLSAATLEPYDLLYDSGVEALQRGDYVVRFMEKALETSAELRQTKIRCGIKCGDEHELDATAAATELQLFDVILRRAACLNLCIESKLGPHSVHKVSADVQHDFHRRIPYNYLQLAYLKHYHSLWNVTDEYRLQIKLEITSDDNQLNQTKKAAAAAHTYFQANPEHIEINLEQYKALHGVEEKHFVDRENRPHQRIFTAAVQLYEEGNFEESVGLFEEALAEYFNADTECRVLCEGPQNFRDHDHVLYRYTMAELISDHYTQVLNCQRDCVRDLATRPGRLSPMENYLPLHYDYLQFAYFQGEEFMTENVEYYMEMLGHGAQPRQEAVHYLQRHKKELELLVIGTENLGVSYTQENYWSNSGGRDDETRIPSGTDGWLEFVPITKKNISRVMFTQQQLQEGGSLLYDSVRLVHNSHSLNGTQRVVLDDIITEDECSELRHLAHITSSAGDGYRGKMSPHTPNEKFEGTTVLRTLKVILCSIILVCALLYLNGDFDGGEFIFTKMDAKTITVSSLKNLHCVYTRTHLSLSVVIISVLGSVKPRCGRMVGFSSGGENPHGVRAVTRGQRCAVALWFTLDPLYRELVSIDQWQAVHLVPGPSVGIYTSDTPLPQLQTSTLQPQLYHVHHLEQFRINIYLIT